MDPPPAGGLANGAHPPEAARAPTPPASLAPQLPVQAAVPVPYVPMPAMMSSVHLSSFASLGAGPPMAPPPMHIGQPIAPPPVPVYGGAFPPPWAGVSAAPVLPAPVMPAAGSKRPAPAGAFPTGDGPKTMRADATPPVDFEAASPALPAAMPRVSLSLSGVSRGVPSGDSESLLGSGGGSGASAGKSKKKSPTAGTARGGKGGGGAATGRGGKATAGRGRGKGAEGFTPKGTPASGGSAEPVAKTSASKASGGRGSSGKAGATKGAAGGAKAAAGGEGGEGGEGGGEKEKRQRTVTPALVKVHAHHPYFLSPCPLSHSSHWSHRLRASARLPSCVLPHAHAWLSRCVCCVPVRCGCGAGEECLPALYTRTQGRNHGCVPCGASRPPPTARARRQGRRGACGGRRRERGWRG